MIRNRNSMIAEPINMKRNCRNLLFPFINKQHILILKFYTNLIYVECQVNFYIHLLPYNALRKFIMNDRIYFSFLINEPRINIGYLFYYIKNSEELIHNLIIKGMKKSNLVHMKVLFKYFYVSVKKFINSEEIKFDFICRALSHNETYPIKNQPLDIFCRSLSKKLNILYFDEFLIKKHINEKLTYLSKINRVNQIHNNYYCNKKIKLKLKPFPRLKFHPWLVCRLCEHEVH